MKKILIVVAAVVLAGLFFWLGRWSVSSPDFWKKWRNSTSATQPIFPPLGAAVSVKIEQKDGTYISVPGNVQAVYESLASYLYRIVSRCRWGGQTIYRVSGGTGYVGVTYYLDLYGREMAHQQDSDAGDHKPSIDLSAYECEVLARNY